MLTSPTHDPHQILMILTFLNHKGEIESEAFVGKNRKAATVYLQKTGKTLITLKKIGSRYALHQSHHLVLDFFHALSILLTSGQSLLPALEDIYKSFEQRSPHKFMAPIVFFLGSHMKNGGDFAKGMAFFPKVFDATTIAIIERGLQAGQLTLTFEKAYHFLKRRNEQKKSLEKALLYPLFLCVAFVLLFWVMTEFFLPNVASYLQEMGHKELPFASRSLLWLSDFFNQWSPLILSTLSLFLLAITLCCITPQCHSFFTPWILRFPVIGQAYRTFYVCIWLETIGALYGFDHNLKDSLEKAEQSSKNLYFFKLFHSIKNDVMKGVNLCDAMECIMCTPTSRVFRKIPLFSPLTLSLCRLGMKSGQLSEFFIKAHNMEQHFLQDQINGFIKMIEPFFMILMGVLLLWVVMGALLPLYTSLDLVFASTCEIIYKGEPVVL